MRRLSHYLQAGMAALALVGAVGCTGSEVAEVKGHSDQTSGPLWIRPSSSMINCVRAPCPSTIVYDVNIGATEFVYGFDWTALGLNSDEQTRLAEEASKLLLYGHYSATTLDDPNAPGSGESLRIFKVQNATRQAQDDVADNPEADRFYATSGAPCHDEVQCSALLGKLLNRDEQAERWNGIDLGQLKLTPPQEEQLRVELREGRAYVSVGNNDTILPDQLPKATQAFRALAADPLPTTD